MCLYNISMHQKLRNEGTVLSEGKVLCFCTWLLTPKNQKHATNTFLTAWGWEKNDGGGISKQDGKWLCVCGGGGREGERIPFLSSTLAKLVSFSLLPFAFDGECKWFLDIKVRENDFFSIKFEDFTLWIIWADRDSVLYLY